MSQIKRIIKHQLRKVKNFTYQQFLEPLKLKKLNRALNNAVQFQAISVKESKHIVFNSQYPWTYIWTEYLLASHLQAQGHQVDMLLCDGLTYCEQETLTTPKPDCASCFKRCKRQVESFNLPYKSIGQFLSDKDRLLAKRISEQTSLIELKRYVLNEINIGNIAYNNLIHYFKGIFPLRGKVEQKYRQIFASAYLVALATTRYFEGMNDVDAVVSANGKFIQSAIAVNYAVNHQIDYITWEVFNQFTSCIFAKNNLALEQRIDDVWGVEKDKPLSDQQLEKILDNFAQQAKSTNTPFQYQEAGYLADQTKILTQFGFTKEHPIIVAFPNVEWDSTAMLPSGFDGMLDWLTTLIDYAILHSDYQVIIRAHPGELKVPDDLKTTTPICDRIRDIYGDLPKNIVLIGPYDAVSSYALEALSDVVMVYSSTLGLEFAVRGVRPWIFSDTYYANKGFTLDVQSKEQMYQLLDQKLFSKKLSKLEHDYAVRLAYIARYRRLFRFPYFIKSRFDFMKYINSLDGKDPVIANISQLIVGNGTCLDLGSQDW